MATKVRVPLYDANLTEGVLNSWRKGAGEKVERGEPLVDLVTDKANFEIESPGSGTLLGITADEKSTVPVGYVIAFIGEPGETPPDVTEENRIILAEHLKKAAVAQAPAGGAAGSGGEAGSREAGERVRATPKARKLARELGVDLAEVLKGTGGTRVSEKDVEEYASKRKPG